MAFTNLKYSNRTRAEAILQRRHPEVLALHELDLLAPGWTGHRGKLHPTYLAHMFHTMLQMALAKFRGAANPMLAVPLMQVRLLCCSSQGLLSAACRTREL